MRTVPQPLCPICGNSGPAIHDALVDHLFAAPGTWRIRRCDNAGCQAHWIDPAPAPHDLPIAYRTYYTHGSEDASDDARRGLLPAIRKTFIERRLGYPGERSSLLRFLASLAWLSVRSQGWLYEAFYLRWQPGGRLLEVGCGSGRQLAAMRDAGWIVSGVDFDADAVAAARGRGLDVVVGDVRHLHLPSESFDAIVMAHVLEHVYEPVSLLSECRRLLRPGGTLVSITPNGRSLGHKIFKGAWRGLEPPRHISVFAAKALRLACGNAGLEVERVRITARDAANMFLASTRIRDAAANEQIVRPRRGSRPPIKLQALAIVERVGNFFGLGWGEELVLIARKR